MPWITLNGRNGRNGRNGLSGLSGLHGLEVCGLDVYGLEVYGLEVYGYGCLEGTSLHNESTKQQNERSWCLWQLLALVVVRMKTLYCNTLAFRT